MIGSNVHARAMGVELFDTMIGSNRRVLDVVGQKGLIFMEFCASIGCNMNYINSHESGNADIRFL